MTRPSHSSKAGPYCLALYALQRQILLETLPTAIFGSVKQGIKPNIMALSTLLLLFSIALVTLSYFIGKRGEANQKSKQ
jgi:ABC-type spermidine/putrescine transport system permease subunit II